MSHARCAVTGKVPHASMHAAEVAARNHARTLNAQRQLAPSLYGYRCGWCRRFHVTRDAEHEGVANTLLYAAPSDDLQRWAFPPPHSVPH